ncbi:hypothetical protein AGMMS49982_19830 [Bacteroidia bacterium]|nr:hypothetical protein AGMMS49982_19830 [Bacteroidia bacterium]
MHKHSLISLSLSLGQYADFVDEIVNITKTEACSDYICVANVHMLVEAHNDAAFATAVNDAAITTPDGVPLTWALKWLHGIRQERVAGMDLLPDLLMQASLQKLPVFFYGTTPQILEETEQYVKTHYKGIPSIATYSPPFRDLTKDEDDEIVNKINHSGAKLIFVSLGCPKQEKWMASMKGRINGIMIGIGGALPVLLKKQKRAPRWMQNAGLEWTYRFLQEPKRLWKRYFTTNAKFVFLILKEKRKGKKIIRKVEQF